MRKNTLIALHVQIPPSFPPKLLLDVSIFLNPPVLRSFKRRKLKKVTGKLHFVHCVCAYYLKRLIVFVFDIAIVVANSHLKLDKIFSEYHGFFEL